MRNLFGSPKFLTISVALIALIAIPLTILQIQSQQNLKQEASGSTSFSTSQTATLSCGTQGFDINVSIKNTQSSYSSSSSSIFSAVAKDIQSGESVSLGVVQPGSTVTGIIHTGKTS